MAKTLSKTREIGGSLVVTIPKEIVDDEMLQENEIIEIEIEKRKKDFFGALRGVGSFGKKDELKGQLE